MWRFSLLLIFIVTLSASAQASTHDLRIGILAASTGPLRYVGDQIRAAAEQIELTPQLFYTDITFQFVGGDLAHPSEMARAYTDLMHQGVDVIVGGATQRSARMLRSIAAEFGFPSIPTVLLANSGKLTPGAASYDHVLQMGLSEAQIYGANVHHWIDHYNLSRISTLYDESHDFTFEFGAKVTPEILHEQPTPSDVQELSYFGRSNPGFDYEIDALMSHDSQGVILSVLPWDIPEVIGAISRTTKVQIFVAPPVISSEQITDLSASWGREIAYGVEFWPSDMSDPNVTNFLSGVSHMLDWPGDTSVSTIAIKLYDAVQLVVDRYNHDVLDSNSPWETVDFVEGLVGPVSRLRHERGDLTTMVGPLGLLVGEVDGTVRVMPTPIPDLQQGSYWYERQDY